MTNKPLFLVLAIFAAFVLFVTTGCQAFGRADKSGHAISTESIGVDVDGNGIPDYGNQTFAFGDTEAGPALVVYDSPVLPNGGTDNVAMYLRGFGSGEYSDTPNGWAENWLALGEVEDADGYVVGYGVAGLRDGEYEVNCARADAVIGSRDGWCDFRYYSDSDIEEYVASKNNGSDDCQRTDYTLVARVHNGHVSPGWQLAPSDPNCYEE